MSNPDFQRRNFLALTLLTGLLQIAPIRVLAGLLPTPDEEDPNIYAGPLIDRIQDLLAPMHRGDVTPEQTLLEIERRYADIDVQHELLPFLQSDVPDLSLCTLKLKTGSWKSKMQLQLFVLPTGHSHAPHGHDNLCSYQTLIQGRLQLREFERRRDVAGAMIVAPVDSRLALPGDTFETTQNHHNVHWFGAEEHAVILNTNLIHVDRSAPPGLLIPDSASRIYIDPTGPLIDGEITAPVMDQQSAATLFGSRLPFSLK